jgi:hypothetical protein
MMSRQDFDALGVNRQLLIWAIATRRQLGRWEALVAANLRADLKGGQVPDALIWEAATEHHFLLIAAHHLVRTIDKLSEGEFRLDRIVHDELKEGRDLHEHWIENVPVFNVTPRPREPSHRSGKRFAARNPDRSPYSWLTWDGHAGPKILPNVPAEAVHSLVDQVEAAVIGRAPELRGFVPPRQPSPWLGEDYGRDRWWPRQN